MRVLRNVNISLSLVIWYNNSALYIENPEFNSRINFYYYLKSVDPILNKNIFYGNFLLSVNSCLNYSAVFIYFFRRNNSFI